VICYRFAAYSTPLRTVPASQAGRFNRITDAQPTQYVSLHPLGPLAELMRNADLRSPEQVRAVQMRTWALDVPLDEYPEITFDTADLHEIGPDELVGDDQEACRELAQRLRADTPGAIVPSAALPGTRNAVLFGSRVAAPYLTEPVSRLDIRANITADGGRPLVSLLSLVRFLGQPHPALEAWRSGAPFEFTEPDWSLDR
jgi:RES domain